MQRIVYYNRVFSKESEAVISAFNRGLLYGDGVFETLRAYEGHVFRLEKHLLRLQHSLTFLRMEPSWKAAEMHGILSELLKANSLLDASIRITVFRADGGGLEPQPNAEACILITTKPLTQYHPEHYRQGFRANVVSIRRNIYSPLSRIKSLNYLDNILGRLEARENNAQEALFLNTHGFVVEGATSNIFMVKGKKLFTPPVQAGILPGITRDVILEIAPNIVLEVSEKTFSLEELLKAEEAFLTNSLMEIMPLVAVNNTLIGAGLPGPVSKKLLYQYQRLVKRELGLLR